MIDEELPSGSQSGAELPSGSQSDAADDGPAQSDRQTDAQARHWQAKGNAQGRKTRERELLKDLGVSSLEELRERVAAHRQSEEEAAAAAEAERSEKQELSAKLIAAEKRIRDLERSSDQLNALRSSVIDERIKAVGLAARVHQEAIDDFVWNARKSVRWNDEHTDIVIASFSDPDKELATLEDLVAEIAERKPHLFRGDEKSGTGFFPAAKATAAKQGQSQNQLATPRERAAWGRR